MAIAPKQGNRVASLQTQLGQDVLVVTRFVGQEAMSELFEFEIDALSDREDIDFDALIGTPCSLTVKTAKSAKRHFHGVLTFAEWLGPAGYRHGYKLTLRPWLWLLSHTLNCKIFHDKTAPVIIEEVLQAAGFTDFRLDLTASYRSREYTVQYRESDLDFVTRLMEEEGIAYFFEHEAGKHTLVLVDEKATHKPVPNYGEILFDPVTDPLRINDEHLVAWTARRRFTAGKATINSRDYRKPATNLKKDTAKPHGYAHGELEVYDYEQSHLTPSESEKTAKVRLEARQAIDKRRHARGAAPSLIPGYRVSLSRHPTGGENRGYLVTRCSHELTEQDYRSGGTQGSDQEGYVGSYEFLPDDVAFRPLEVTARPRIDSCQTGLVIGKEGEEIDVDFMGRILVSFPWDPYNDVSRRCRVAQVWAGKGWGAVVTPRIGMEVVVHFQNGDPDYPLVTGCVYNGTNDMPYPLPEKQNVSGVKSRSTKNGDEEGYNEFIFDDTKDEEIVRLHTEKDLVVEVENTETRTIEGKKVAAKGEYARKTMIKKGDEIFELDTGNREETIKQGDDTLTIKQGNRNCEISMGNDDLKIKMGNRTTKISLGSDTTEAMQSITLKVGPSKIVIDPTGITLDAPMITLKGSAMISSTAPLNKMNGDATVMITGGIVMIN